jgi:hypothetical protein
MVMSRAGRNPGSPVRFHDKTVLFPQEYIAEKPGRSRGHARWRNGDFPQV